MPRKKGDGVPLVRVTIAMDRRDIWKICRVAADEGIGHTTWMRERLLEALAARQAKKKNGRKSDGPARRSSKNDRSSTPRRASGRPSSRRTLPSAR